MPPITAPGKLWALMLVIGGCFAVIVASTATGNGAGANVSPAWATIGVVTTYLVTNGVGARKGAAPVPVFAPPAPEPAITITKLTADDAARLEELLGRLSALDEAERLELRELATRGATS